MTRRGTVAILFLAASFAATPAGAAAPGAPRAGCPGQGNRGAHVWTEEFGSRSC
ncbi:MAG: hypothetical protein ACTHK6_10220 [Solirubrobacterales bacterium]